MEEIFTTLIGTGPIGAVLVWFMWQNTKHSKQLMDIVKDNTKAYMSLKIAIETLIHTKKQKTL